MTSDNRTGKSLIITTRFVPAGSRSSGTPVFPGVAEIEHDDGNGIRINIDNASVYITNRELEEQGITLV